MLLKRIGGDGPLIVSCSFPAVALFLNAIKLVLGLILRQDVYPRRRYVLMVRARVSIRARLPDLCVVLRQHVARLVQAVLLVQLLADHGDAFVW